MEESEGTTPGGGLGRAASVEFISMTPAALPAVKDLLLAHWQRTWNDDLCDRIFRWRFLGRPDDEAILGWHGDRCVSIVDSCVRRYLINDEIVRVREPGDWFSRPGYRGGGLEPMWLLMRRPEPMVGIGGSAATRALLPRLKWKPMPQQVGHFILRLTSGAMLHRLLDPLRVVGKSQMVSFGHRVSVPIRRIRRHPPPVSHADVQFLESPRRYVDVLPAPGHYTLARLVDREELEWLYSAPPEMGEFSALEFSSAGKPVGLSVSRLFWQGDYQAATIVHIQAAMTSSDMYSWMVGETAHYLARRGAATIHCRSSCPRLKEALRRAAFSEYSSVNPLWWSRTLAVPSGDVLLSWLRSDDPLLPYPQ